MRSSILPLCAFSGLPSRSERDTSLVTDGDVEAGGLLCNFSTFLASEIQSKIFGDFEGHSFLEKKKPVDSLSLWNHCKNHCKSMWFWGTLVCHHLLISRGFQKQWFSDSKQKSTCKSHGVNSPLCEAWRPVRRSRSWLHESLSEILDFQLSTVSKRRHGSHFWYPKS